MSLYKRVERLERKMDLVYPSGETIYFQVGKGYYDPTLEDLARIEAAEREHDLVQICSEHMRMLIMPFRQDGAT